jgi:hypothetical protein
MLFVHAFTSQSSTVGRDGRSELCTVSQRQGLVSFVLLSSSDSPDPTHRRDHPSSAVGKPALRAVLASLPPLEVGFDLIEGSGRLRCDRPCRGLSPPGSRDSPRRARVAIQHPRDLPRTTAAARKDHSG